MNVRMVSFLDDNNELVFINSIQIITVKQTYEGRILVICTGDVDYKLSMQYTIDEVISMIQGNDLDE